MAKNLYNTLGVEETASAQEIRKGFRKQAMEFHPDKNPTGEEQFKKINAAYEILNDSDKREQYDRGEIDDSGNPVVSETQSETSQSPADVDHEQEKKTAADKPGSTETTDTEQLDIRGNNYPTGPNPSQDQEPKKDNQEPEANNKGSDDRATVLIAMMLSIFEMVQGVYSGMWQHLMSGKSPEPTLSDKKEKTTDAKTNKDEDAKTSKDEDTKTSKDEDTKTSKDEDTKTSKDEDTKTSKDENPKTEVAAKENPKADLSKLSTDSVIPAIQLEATNAANYDKDVSQANKTAQPTPPEEAPDIEMNKPKI